MDKSTKTALIIIGVVLLVTAVISVTILVTGL